jgi:hypothetical protein
MYQQIVNRKNLEEAYFKIASDMELDGRLARYRGWDSLRLADLELSAYDIIQEALQELKELKIIAPAVLFKIPKKSNPQKLREIYIYNLKERIKAQAIYQIVESVFNEFFSPYLFSYRSSHPSYFAARSTIRHYLKCWTKDYVLVGDLSDYSNYIRHDKLKDKLANLGLDKKTVALLHLFINNPVVRDGRVEYPQVGLVQGVPLIALFNNLYLDEFDKQIGPKVDFYRRVGDDLLVFDKNKDKLLAIRKQLFDQVNDLGLKINTDKSGLKQAACEFNFLGYYFKEGLVSLPANFYEALIKKWQSQFSYYRFRSLARKEVFLRQVFKRSKLGMEEQWRQLADQKKLVNNEKQIRLLSEDFFHILTRYFFRTYSSRHRRLLQLKLKQLKLVSIYQIFNQTRYGKY